MAFIEPRYDLKNESAPHETLGISILSGSRPLQKPHLLSRLDATFRSIAQQINSIDLVYEDQCSLIYYLDLVRTLRRLKRGYSRVVEVGVFMGGASTVLAGLQQSLGFELDLVDVNRKYLHFTAERIRRTYPNAKFRLWEGTLPSYVKNVLMQEECKIVLQHDGAHDFNTVVADLASLSFVSDKVHAILAQDTNLRGTLEYMNFVDVALLAIFGTKMKAKSIGLRPPMRLQARGPNEWEGNYSLTHKPEGQVVKISNNRFEYPHPSMKFDAMFPNA